MHAQTRSSRLPRFVGEGVMIVVSILLAFAIDALWDASREADLERAYLLQVRSELQAARGELTTAQEVHTSISDAVVRLLVGIEDIPDGDLIDTARAAFVLGLSTHLRSGLVEPTQLALVSDVALKDMLARWPGTYAEFKEEEDWIMSVFPALIETAGTRIDFSSLLGPASTGIQRAPPDLGELRRDLEGALSLPIVRSTLGLRAHRERIAGRDAGRLRDVVDEIIGAIGVAVGDRGAER